MEHLPRHRHVYPRTGTYVTRAWAEGAIDGAPADYEVAHLAAASSRHLSQVYIFRVKTLKG